MSITPIRFNLTLQVGVAHAAWKQLDRMVQERRNASASAMDLRLSCIDPTNWRW